MFVTLNNTKIPRRGRIIIGVNTSKSKKDDNSIYFI